MLVAQELTALSRVRVTPASSAVRATLILASTLSFVQLLLATCAHDAGPAVYPAPGHDMGIPEAT